VTVVGPTGKIDPLGGTQATAIGDCPPVAVGVPYTMEIGWLNGDCSDIGAGQEIFGGSATGGGVGCVWLLLHALSSTTPASAVSTRRRE